MVKKYKDFVFREYKHTISEKILIYALIFIVGCIVGYIYEVIFAYFDEGKFVNRGFLFGPYLPIYGIGACFITLLLKRFRKYPILLFFSCFVLTGIVEYAGGAILMELFNKRWWDYTGLFLNINGYVCLRSLLTFAIGGLLLIYIIEPYIRSIVNDKYKKYLIIYTIIFLGLMLIDFIFTILIRHQL